MPEAGRSAASGPFRLVDSRPASRYGRRAEQASGVRGGSAKGSATRVAGGDAGGRAATRLTVRRWSNPTPGPQPGLRSGPRDPRCGRNREAPVFTILDGRESKNRSLRLQAIVALCVLLALIAIGIYIAT